MARRARSDNKADEEWRCGERCEGENRCLESVAESGKAVRSGGG
jgi:hypothetical protein